MLRNLNFYPEGREETHTEGFQLVRDRIIWKVAWRMDGESEQGDQSKIWRPFLIITVPALLKELSLSELYKCSLYN